jgi:hypothetical protein
MGAPYGGVDMITGKTVGQTPYRKAEEAEIFCEFRNELNFATHKEMIQAFNDIGKLTNRTGEDVFNETYRTWLSNRLELNK